MIVLQIQTRIMAMLLMVLHQELIKETPKFKALGVLHSKKKYKANQITINE